MELNTASISWSWAEKGVWWVARRASLLLSWSGSEVKLLSSGAGGGPVPRLELLISPLGPAGPRALWPGWGFQVGLDLFVEGHRLLGGDLLPQPL